VAVVKHDSRLFEASTPPIGKAVNQHLFILLIRLCQLTPLDKVMGVSSEEVGNAIDLFAAIQTPSLPP
jgi:hypothetical protein